MKIDSDVESDEEPEERYLANGVIYSDNNDFYCKTGVRPSAIANDKDNKILYDLNGDVAELVRYFGNSASFEVPSSVVIDKKRIQCNRHSR